MTHPQEIPMPDDFDSQPAEVIQLGPSEGITEETFAQNLAASTPAPEEYATPGPPATMEQVVRTVEMMEHDHRRRTGELNEQGAFFSGVNHEMLSRALSQFSMEQIWYYQNRNNPRLTADEYIAMMKRYTWEQTQLIRALLTALHEAGAI